MIEVQPQRAIVPHRLHHGAELALAIGRGQLDHIAHGVLLLRIAQLVQLLARQPLDHVRVALAEGFTGRHVEAGARALLQTQQAPLDRRRQLAAAQRQRGRRPTEGADDIALRAGEAVMQGQKGSWLDGAHEWCPDKLPRF